MGMTIDDARYCLENGGFCSASCKYFSVGDPNCEDNVRKIAIDTMRKYQKIEDIYYHQSGEALENSLRAVVEDGKID